MYQLVYQKSARVSYVSVGRCHVPIGISEECECFICQCGEVPCTNWYKSARVSCFSVSD
jgi:hypothetical protein